MSLNDRCVAAARARSHQEPDPGRTRRAGFGGVTSERLGISRQKINYHLRALRIMSSSSRPMTVNGAASRSAWWLRARIVPGFARGARTDRRRSRAQPRSAVGKLSDRARGTHRARGRRALASRAQDDKRLATLSIDTVIRFRSPADRAAFTEDLDQRRSRHWPPAITMTGAAGRPHRSWSRPIPLRSTT